VALGGVLGAGAGAGPDALSTIVTRATMPWPAPVSVEAHSCESSVV
jgi:hypothetical protein